MFDFGYGYPKTTQIATTSGASVAITNPVGDHIHCVRLIADTECHVAIGKTPTATTSTVYLAADVAEYFVIHPGEKVAVIADAAILNVTEITR